MGLQSLPGSCLAWGLGLYGRVKANSKRAPRETFGAPIPVVSHCWGPPTLVQSPMGSLLLSSGSWCAQNFVCTLQDCSLCLPQSSGSPIIKSCWPSRSDSQGIPSLFVGSPGWEAWHGVQNLHNKGRTSLVLLLSSLWITHLAGIGFDLSWLCPSYHFTAASCLWAWGMFFW